MLIHHYRDTGEYAETTEARPDPRNPDRHLVPGNATAIEPPSPIQGQARVFKDGEWGHVADHRGTVYWLEDGTRHEISALGETVPDEAYLEEVDIPGIPATGDDVNTERERRVEAGTDITLSDGTVVALQGRDEDLRNLLARYTVAAERHSAGDVSEMVFRDRENVIHLLTPDQMIELYLAGQSWVEAVYMASWSLKDASGPIPADYADDAHWP